MAQFSDDPTVPADRDGDDYGDLLDLLDRMRQNYELMEGSAAQKDAGIAVRVEVPNGTTLTTTMTPSKGQSLIVEEVTVAPSLQNATYYISAAGDSTDASTLPFGVPQVTSNPIKVKTTNTTGATAMFEIFLDARQVRER